MHESVVEGGVDVGDAEHLDTLADLGSKGDLDLLLRNLILPGRHSEDCSIWKRRRKSSSLDNGDFSLVRGLWAGISVHKSVL